MKEVKRRFRGKGSRKGFTLVELMIVIAIIAILAAVAITQYSAYRNKAKAKDLVGFARACAMEILTQCQADSSFNDTSSLESCAISNNETKYLVELTVDHSDFDSCNEDFTIKATGKVKNTDKTYKVECTYTHDDQSISCKAPQEGS